MRFLAIHAHPDDIEVQCAGTLALLAAAGHSIAMVTMTPGDCGSQDLGPEEIAAVRREEARRYARLVATDIRLYNEEAVVVGRKQRDLVTRLAEPMRRGRESFARRFPDLGAAGAKLLDDAYTHVLAGGDASLLA